MVGCEAVQIRPGEGLLVPFADPRPLAFSLERDRHHQTLALAAPPPNRASATGRGIVDHMPAGAAGPAIPHVSSRSLRELEAVMQIDFDRIGALRRCSQCLLPETFPFIEFDAAAVCQHCRNHQPLRQMSEKELQTHCDSVRRTDGRPDCLIPVSGGRDSSYGLHYIKKVLGLNPVAYTYDWGMVTDLARRNISRMCEALEVEHVLVAADIAQKREFVRLNVSAWLKRPNLGTVPLFMAGDKQFFYYAEALKRQMELRTIIFSHNRFERTDFKIGFCGIDDTLRRKKLHGISFMSKVHLALFYAKEFALNPTYLNRSIIDTLSAYLSFYVLPFDYLQLYDYLQWDEPLIEDTLVNGYDWEVSNDTRTTWRIGDGTAPFYNYIYLRIAGFTENDTFRSNQIREGLLSRNNALDRVLAENRPRPEGFKWYCDTIGIDPIDTLRIINQIPTRYS
jgi:glucosamine--fructose-6-phosphate aminotransferase (isomerizing)